MPSSTLQLVHAPQPQHFTQVLATLAVALGTFAAGLGKGYSSPALASLQEQGSNGTFTITAQEGSWVASLSLLGALFGGIVGGIAMKYGRKRTLITTSVPFSASWLLTVFAQNVAMMYATAFIGGFCSAIILLVTQIYISEIAHPEIRGCLCAIAKISGHIGLLFGFILGTYLDWRQLAMVAAGAPAMLFISSIYVPETPSFLLLQGQEGEAAQALQWLRGSQTDISIELDTIHNNIRKKKEQVVSCQNVLIPRLVRPILITCGVMFFHRFSGANAFNFYAVPIFRQTFGGMNPHGAAIVVGVVQLLAAMISGLLIDTVGRLPLLIISNMFMSAALAGFGLFVYVEDSEALSEPNYNSTLDCIPLTCVLVFTIAFSLGLSPISWLLIGELFPLEYRGIGGAIATSFSYACAFVGVKTFVDFQLSLGLHGAFWLYAGISVIGLVFMLVWVPETKGRTLDEMEQKFTQA